MEGEEVEAGGEAGGGDGELSGVEWDGEEFMACGMGACAGCAVPLAAGGYARVCADGPIFKAGEVLL